MNKSSFIIFAALLFVFAQGYEEFELYQALWDAWKDNYGKEYQTSMEDSARFEIFSNNYDFINQWNSENHMTRLALNNFADLTNEEFAALYANAELNKTAAAFKGKQIKRKDDPIPAHLDWREEDAVSSVKIQGPCGSDYAFAAAGALEGLNAIWNAAEFESLSAQEIIDCCDYCNGCSGGDAMVVFDWISGYGAMTDEDYPYKAKGGQCKYNPN
mmetsp:Transcript_17731/g.15534  ORF Transcript_17731/g.15534 Transcript_17731/m.15534 type:complete len:215 (+) Transcript_17731:43-687(+)